MCLLCSCKDVAESSISSLSSEAVHTDSEAVNTFDADTTTQEAVTSSDFAELNYTFAVYEDSIDVMWSGEVIQTLECSPFTDNMLITDDYNFDGYNDLFVITDVQDVKLSGTYFKFNPDTSQFEEWDELNNIGHTLDIGISSNVSIGQTLSYSTSKPDEHETFIYKWENDKLILVERRITLIDNENNTAVTELYYIDDNGNEILIESAERDLNEHPLDFD